MRRVGRGPLALVLACALILMVSGGAGAAIAYDETRLTSAPADQTWPVVSGDKVAWMDERNGQADIWYADLVTGSEFRVTNSTTLREDSVDIDGDLICWTDGRNGVGDSDVYLYDIPTATEQRVTFDNTVFQGQSRVSGDRVVWADQRNSPIQRDIYVYDRSRDQESVVCTDSANQEYPDISGDIVVWSDFRNGGIGNMDLYGYDLATGTEFPICTEPGLQVDGSVHGDIVAWIDYRFGWSEIYRYDLSTGIESRVTSSTSNKFNVRVGERYITWDDHRLPPTSDNDIFAYDIQGGFVTDVITEGDRQEYASSSGARLAWSDLRNHGGSFYDAYLADTGVEWTRAAGPDRFQTAVDIVRSHPTFGAEVAVVATGEDFPDALSAAGLAGYLDAPLFLVNQDSVPAAVHAELTRRQVDWIVIIGGEGAVSKDVEDWLRARYPAVTRLNGQDRYQTAIAVADTIRFMNGGTFPSGDVFLARGDAFPDALALSPIAFAKGAPILLTPPDALWGATATMLGHPDLTQVFIAGGEGAISDAVRADVDVILAGKGAGPSFRWAGSDRYATAAEIADEAAKIDWANVGFVGIATGLDFPDALAGGAAAGREHGVLLLSDRDALSASARAFLSAYADGIDRVEGFGGESVISDDVLHQAVARVNQ